MKFSNFILYLFALSFILVSTGCKKNDYQIEKTKSNLAEDRFFNSHRSTSSHVQALSESMKINNSKTHFVERVIKKIGFPYWDKALIIDKSNSGKSNSEESITYIPFVRDSQYSVNSVLAIKISQGDTTYRYTCDWQYNNLPHGNSSENTAEGLSVFFMAFDNFVFGHQKFHITSNTLFNNSSLSQPRKEITITNSFTVNKSGKSNLQICEVGYYCGDPSSDDCENGCDYMACSQSPAWCFPLLLCVDVTIPGLGTWYPWGPVSGGPTGGGGGGYTGGGGEEPPECEEPSGKSSIEEECGPGWNPLTNANGYYYSRIAFLDSLLDVDVFSLTNPCPYLQQFQWIAQFQVPQVVQNRLTSLREANPWLPFNDNFFVQNLNSAAGSVLNCDYFPIRITSMPKTNGVDWTAKQLLDYFRLNINTLVNTSICSFFPYNYAFVNDTQLWQSSNPLGALVHLDFHNVPNDGSVVVSQYTHTATSAQMILTTVRTPFDSRHPVTGNRVFGVMPDPNYPGGFIFYTTAVDRVTTGLWSFFNEAGEFVPIIASGFEDADNLWRSMQTNMANMIVNNGGMAGPLSNLQGGELTHRPLWAIWEQFLMGLIDWEQLKAIFGC